LAESLTSIEHSGAGPLLDKLGGLPLALVQAGAYIGATSLTVEKYIVHYDKTWDKLMMYQDRYRLQEYAESVLTTWKISYEQVRTVKPEAARLLDQWAFLHPGDISYELIQRSTQSIEDREETLERESIATDELSFEDSVGVLAQYSLVNNIEERSSFSIHAVVHEWSLHNIINDQARERLCIKAIRMVAKSIPSSNDLGDLQAARILLPHARMAARRYNKMRGVANIELQLHQIAYFMQDWESSQEVEGLYIGALKGKEEVWGPKHTSTLDTVNNLGLLYYKQGKTKEAEEMYLRALKGKEEAYGPNHMSTLDTVNNLGLLYSDQGKTKEAEEVYVQALKGYEEVWGPKHTSTLGTVNNLANLYCKQGKMKEAEGMHLRALRGYEEACGPNHTATIRTVRYLSELYSSQARTAYIREMRSRLRLIRSVTVGQHKSPKHFLPMLIFLCYRFPYDNTPLLGTIGRVLLWVGDNENAQLAFQNQVINVESIRSHGDTVCDSCEQSLTFDTKRLVCKACADVDLCEACYQEYEILDPAESAMADCTGHQFLAVRQPDCWQADSVEGLRTWMSRMLQLYPIATDF
jgi:tetratricopeptide (TPR) repeat protein